MPNAARLLVTAFLTLWLSPLPAQTTGSPGADARAAEIRADLGAEVPRDLLRSGEPDVRLRSVEGTPFPAAPSEPFIPPGHESVAPEGAELIRFELNHVEIRGATAFEADALESAIADRYGTTVSLADVYELAATVQRRYREEGYFLSRVVVPPQHIAGGRLHIQVLEGYVEAVDIQGDIGPVQRLIESYLAPVTRERPLKLSTLERSLLLAKDVPGIDVKGVLARSESVVGASRLLVTASRDRFDGLALVDNIGSTFTGEWEIAARLGVNSLTRFGENLAFTGLLSDPEKGAGQDTKNQKVAMLSSSARLGRYGTHLTGFVSYGDSNPGGIIEDFDYDSKKLLVSVGAVHPMIRGRSSSLFVSLGFDYIDSDTDIFVDEPFITDRLRVLQLAADYDFRDRWRGSSFVRLAVRRGLEAFGATEAEDEMASRFDASGDFTNVRGTVSRLQAISDRWAVYALVSAQYAFDPVLADEEFDVGGIDFGRGYNPKELSGDSGVGLTTEIQYTRPSSFWFLDRYQLFAFYDFGAVRQKDNDLVSDASASLASAGGGFRGWFAGDISLELQVAKPLTLPSARADDTKEAQLLLRAIAHF